VVCSDLPSLREVGGDAVSYARTGDLPDLRGKLEQVLLDPKKANDMRAQGLRRAEKFSWQAHARTMLDIYREVIETDRARHQ